MARFISTGVIALSIISPIFSHPATLHLRASDPSNDEGFIPESFRVGLDRSSVFTRNVPDLIDSAWLTANTIKDMAALPYQREIPIINIQASNVPGVAIGMKAAIGDHMQTRYQMWALERCFLLLGLALEQGDISPRCDFGFAKKATEPGKQPVFDETLGRVHFVKTKVGEATDALVGAGMGVIGEEHNLTDTLPSDGGIETWIARPERVAHGDIAKPTREEIGDWDAGTPKFTAVVQCLETATLDPTTVASLFNYALIALAADERSREDEINRTGRVGIRNRDTRAKLHYQPADTEKLPEYKAYTEGLVSVFFKVKKYKLWGKCAFDVYSITEQGEAGEKVLEGAFQKSEDEGGDVQGGSSAVQ